MAGSNHGSSSAGSYCPDGTPLLCMEEGNDSTAVWSYGDSGIPGALRLISVAQLLDQETCSIALYEWKPELLKFPRDGSVLTPALQCPRGMPCYAAVSHTWMQSKDVMERGKVAGRPVSVQTRLDKEGGEKEKKMVQNEEQNEAQNEEQNEAQNEEQNEAQNEEQNEELHEEQNEEQNEELHEEQNKEQNEEKKEKESSTHEISWLGLVQAATAAEDLECEYLWIDLLCLNQVDSEDKRKQIANMHRIFANATAVVVMPGGLSAAQGVDSVSTWINRAWTLQEATLCNETWALVDWAYSGKSFATNKYSAEFTKLDGNIAIVRVDKLLEFKPGEKLGAGTFDFAGDGVEAEEVELDLKVWCLGRDPSCTFALASAIAARRIDGAFRETEGSSSWSGEGHGLVFDEDRNEGGDEDEVWEDVTVRLVGSSSDSGTSDGEGQVEFSDEDLIYPEDRSLSSFNPDDSDATENNHEDEDNPERPSDMRSYQSENEEDKTVLRHCAAWRSMWLRTSTRPQDTVFSTMHLIGASIEVDYNRSLPELIFDLVRRTSSIPAWLTIGYDTPVMPSSGLIPEIPKFTPQSEPTYVIDGQVIPAAKTVSGDYRCYRFDIEIKSTDIKHGHLICARMLDVNEKRGPEPWTKDRAFDHQSDVRLTSPGYNLSTTCRFKGKMGSLVVIVGRRLAESDLGNIGWLISEDYEPLVYLLDKNEEGVWQKTGGGTLMEDLFSQPDEAGGIAWRHLRVGGEPGAEVEECDCGKAKPRRVRSVKAWEFQGQEAMDDALRKACYRGKEKTARLLVCAGANPNAGGGEYAYALQAACIGGKDRIVEFLIETGADIHAQGGRFGNALQAAASAGNHRIVRLLIQKGVDINIHGGQYQTALQAAARDSQDNQLSAKALIDAGADVNAEGGTEGDALTAAASSGSVSLVEILLRHGADVRGHGGEHGSPLIAAAGRDEKPSLELVRILTQHGADPNAQGAAESKGGRRIVTALQSACQSLNYETVRYLLEHGADVNATGGDYWTALGAAAHYAALAVCKLLIAHGADVNAQGGLWGTALQAAVTEEEPNPEDAAVMQLLIQHGADVNIRGGKYGSALQAAVHLKRGNRARLLVQAGAGMDVDEEYADLLPKVLASGYERMVQWLIEKGSDVNATGGRYGTALQAAAANDARRLIKLLGGRLIGSRPIHGVSEQSHLKVVQLLVEKGAKVNVRGGYYGTPLQAAAYAGNAEVVQHLVLNGANVNTKGGRYGIALQAAARCGHLVIVKSLIQAGAKVNAQCGRFGTALQAASRYDHISVAECLVDAGANVDLAVDPSGKSAVGLHGNALLAAVYYGTEMVELLLSKGASVNGVDDQGRNALHVAAALGHCKLIDLLLPLIYVGDARFSADRLGRTYFHHAAASGSVEAVDRFIALPGLQRDAIDIDGWNSLHWAARKGTKSVVRRLLAAGMDRAARTGVGTVTALRVAIFHKHLSLAPLLEIPSASTKATTPEPTAARADLGTSIRQGVMEDPDGTIVGFQHHDIYCQGCKFEIFGPLYSCRKCRHFDYCFRCTGPLGWVHIQKHPGHSFPGLGDENMEVPERPAKRVKKE